MTRGDKLIRPARNGFPAKYCTGLSHYLLSKDGTWTVCDQYLRFNHAKCHEVKTTFQGFTEGQP